MPQLLQIALADIDEPPLPARVSMDDEKLAELRESLAAVGLINPVVLIRDDLRFRLGPGHRRFTAARQLGWQKITALVYEAAEYDEHASMLAENRYREDMSAAEEAIWFSEVQDRLQLDEAGLCAHFKITPDYLGDRIRLLRGDDNVFQALLARRINFSVARELNKCDDQGHRRYLLDVAERSGYAARVIADMVRQWRVSASPMTVDTPAPAAAAVPTPVEPFRVECALCGGGKDPWNLIDVRLHKWEWEMILAQIQKAQKEEACAS